MIAILLDQIIISDLQGPIFYSKPHFAGCVFYPLYDDPRWHRSVSSDFRINKVQGY